MKTTLTRAKLPLMLTTVGLLSGMAGAQPDLGAAKGANPPNRTPGQLVQNMTPEQRRVLMQGRIEEQLQNRRAEMLRQSLAQGGFDDKVVQEVVVDFSNEQVKAALSLREKTTKISEALNDKATTDMQISALLNDMHTAQTDEKGRREAAEKALDAKINYTKKPRLEALLTTLNLIGEDSVGLMNIMGSLRGGAGLGGGALGGGAAGGFGGRGGGLGGGRGGFGANQNGAGNGQNAPGNDVFGLRRDRALRRDGRNAKPAVEPKDKQN